jgi:hypothetical protein
MFSPSNPSMNLEYKYSHDLNFSNRLVRTGMLIGAAGARLTAAPFSIKRLEFTTVALENENSTSLA